MSDESKLQKVPLSHSLCFLAMYNVYIQEFIDTFLCFHRILWKVSINS